MSIFGPGKPRKETYDSSSKGPSDPGVYRIKDEEGKFAYIGKAWVMKDRVSDHKSDGKFFPGETVDFLIAPEGTTEEELAEAERQQIRKYKPYRNKRGGGAGRPRSTKEYEAPTYEPEKPILFFRILGGFFKLIKWIIRIAIILLIVGAIVYVVGNYVL